MSTYNGEKYICQQIDSILQQEDVEVNLLVRDDGSTDKTHSILKDYAEKGMLSWYKGDNLGPAHSFLQLLKDAPESDYYAFSDQDDYWQKDKISTAINKIRCSNEPSLYFCQTQLADKDLTPIPTPVLKPLCTFGEALVYQFIGGCTMVMNNALRDIVISYNPSFLQMHDVWIYCIAKAVDAVVYYDPIPHILYRQHETNVVGQGYGQLKEWKKRIGRLLNKRQERYHIAVELQHGYQELMNQENADLLEKFVLAKQNFSKRMALVSDKHFRCSDAGTYRRFILSLLLNTY